MLLMAGDVAGKSVGGGRRFLPLDHLQNKHNVQCSDEGSGRLEEEMDADKTRVEEEERKKKKKKVLKKAVKSCICWDNHPLSSLGDLASSTSITPQGTSTMNPSAKRQLFWATTETIDDTDRLRLPDSLPNKDIRCRTRPVCLDRYLLTLATCGVQVSL
ncbi:hypothetical protein R6Q59_006398 [Mikania micrantha]